MPSIEVLPNSASISAPGWAYVPDLGYDPSKSAIQPSGARKRAARTAGIAGGDTSTRQQNAILRHLAELDKDNHRDVQIPVPARFKEKAGSKTKTTSNVRRILTSQKTFANHLADEEAVIASQDQQQATPTHPNDRIVFIKPLPGPTAQFAQDFLSRIAAICKPIMAAAHISVMTLEEYEPNPEFVGRNFNAGEIIQLVLKAPRTGHWLSFRSVQMVMMHELAHCLQMNHGRDFWKVRNQFARELKELWGKGYTGDGFWGRGKTLLSDQYDNQGSWEEEVMPERLCGGTYRTRRGRKRKRGEVKTEELTYAERKQRRIERKFGKNGQALGSEEETRVKLENGKKSKGKPRVAGSARGRELRAAAALARFGQQKEEEEVKREENLDWSETASEDDLEDVKSEEGAIDIDGSRLLDSKGRDIVKVCEDEDQDDVHSPAREKSEETTANSRRERAQPPGFDLNQARNISSSSSINTIEQKHHILIPSSIH
ncbi:MAG: hypothetical protein L6R37_004358 [Teloschistes peruensis]|nr:MAG: hypothetical protein L6R37_004358 [Teloschistes peruensis]